MKVEIKTAETAGMCYGVKRAIKIAEKNAEKPNTFTYGELIHNRDVVKRLAEKGVLPSEDFSDCPRGASVIIRSHGVGADVYGDLAALGVNIIDATCPDVVKIQKIAAEHSRLGADIIICGDSGHPEVKGILGHMKGGRSFTAASADELEALLKTENLFGENVQIILAQTTFDVIKWRECKKIIKKHCTKAKIFDTICITTMKRQEEAKALAKECDLMVVLGAPHSSNSGKLAEICGRLKKTVFIENSEQLNADDILILLSGEKDVKIGVTAGASTPADIIKEVQIKMSEIIKSGGAEIAENGDIDFMAEVDRTFKRIYIGNRVKAYVVAVNKTEAVVDMGTKHSGYIPADEITSDPGKLPTDIVKVGDEIDCVVTSINDAEGVVYLSKKKVDAMLGLEKILEAKESGVVLNGVVAAAVKGGVIVVYEGARVFVPASQSGVPRSGKLEELQRKTVKFKILEVSENRSRIVGSIKAASQEENEAARQKFWSEIEEGQRFTGEVKSMESYGVFVDLGGVDGMVHLSELTWERVRHPREVVSVGDKLDVYVKSFDLEKKRVSLGARSPEDNPWTKFAAEFSAGDKVKVQVVSITPFGAFAQIIPGVDGLIHISQISEEKVANVGQALSVGQVVDVLITEIDTEKNRVSLSIRALLEQDKPEDDLEPETVYSDDAKPEDSETE